MFWGYADTVRDPRGFAIKSYTQHGNYDMVGNNTPVFFMRDPQKFQDFIHSQKRLPDTNTRDHNMQWDYWTLSPESAHMVTWLMGDRGIPRTWRHMNGYGGHTYLWENAGGEKFWVKYHFKTDQGIEFFTDAKAKAMTAEDPDYHLRDLYQAIGRRDHPAWTLRMQIMPFEEAAGAKSAQTRPCPQTTRPGCRPPPRPLAGTGRMKHAALEHYLEVGEDARAIHQGDDDRVFSPIFRRRRR
jgi:catalase